MGVGPTRRGGNFLRESRDDLQVDWRRFWARRAGAVAPILLTTAGGFAVGLGRNWLTTMVVLSSLMVLITAITSYNSQPSLRPKVADAPPSQRTASSVPTSWVLVMVALSLAVIDYRAFLRSGSNLRFFMVGAAMLLGLGMALRSESSWHKPSHVSVTAAKIFAAYAFFGAVIGKFWLNSESPALSLSLPLLFVFLPRPAKGPTKFNTGKMRLSLLAVLSLFIVMDALAWLTPFPGAASRGNYSHERAHLLVAGVFAAYLLLRGTKRIVLFAAFSVLAVLIFLQYPAATYVVATGAALVTLAVSSRRLSLRRAARIVATTSTFVLIWAALNLSSATAWTSHYFQGVGKQSNTPFRLEVYRSAIERIEGSPWIGSLFTGNTTVRIPSSRLVESATGRLYSVEPHSDILQIWMLGGLIAVILLVAWVAGTNIIVIRFIASADASERHLVTILLLIFNGFFAVGLVNPVISQISNTFILSAVYYTLLVLTLEERNAIETSTWYRSPQQRPSA